MHVGVAADARRGFSTGKNSPAQIVEIWATLVGTVAAGWRPEGLGEVDMAATAGFCIPSACGCVRWGSERFRARVIGHGKSAPYGGEMSEICANPHPLECAWDADRRGGHAPPGRHPCHRAKRPAATVGRAALAVPAADADQQTLDQPAGQARAGSRWAGPGDPPLSDTPEAVRSMSPGKRSPSLGPQSR